MARTVMIQGDGDTLWLPDGSNWDDLRFPAQGINPVGPVNPPDRSTSSGDLLFDPDAVEIIAGFAQLPHHWQEGSPIHAHIHWRASNTGTGDIVWKFEYKIANRNGNFPADYISESIVVAAPASAVKHNRHDFSAIDMSGFKVSCMIDWRLSRTATSVSDTYAADVGLMEMDFHYQLDSLGSGAEDIKY